MNAAHIHLIINHIPVIGTVFGLIFVLIAAMRKNRVLIRAAMWMLFLVAISAVPAYLTGEPAEEMIESLPGISGEIIYEHEESAEIAFISAIAMGLLAFGGLIVLRANNRVSGIFMAALIVVTIITAALMAGTANTGGVIRHPEIIDSSVIPVEIEQVPQVENENDED